MMHCFTDVLVHSHTLRLTHLQRQSSSYDKYQQDSCYKDWISANSQDSSKHCFAHPQNTVYALAGRTLRGLCTTEQFLTTDQQEVLL